MEAAPFPEDSEHHYARGLPIGKKVLLKSEDGTVKQKFPTIAKAIKSWRPGDTVFVSRGVYKESIEIMALFHDGIRIVGESKEDTIVEGQREEANALTSYVKTGTVSNLTFCLAPNVTEKYTVTIRFGSVVLEDCIIYGRGKLSAIGVYLDGSAEEVEEIANSKSTATIKGNVIYGAHGGGVLVREEGHAILDSNKILRCGADGVEVRTQGVCVLKNNEIMDCSSGLYISEGGTATVVSNNIHHNRRNGVSLAGPCRGTLSKNHIHHNNEHGVAMRAWLPPPELGVQHRKGPVCALVQENTIEANTTLGVRISGTVCKATVEVKKNTIVGNLLAGILVEEQAEPYVVQNKLEGHECGLLVASLAKPVVKDNAFSAAGFTEERWWIAARFYEGSAGEMTGNKLTTCHVEIEQATDVAGPCQPALAENEYLHPNPKLLRCSETAKRTSAHGLLNARNHVWIVTSFDEVIYARNQAESMGSRQSLDGVANSNLKEQNPRRLKGCSNCSRSSPDFTMRCSKCAQVYYCSKECQVANWPEHKPYCRAARVVGFSEREKYLMSKKK